MVTPPNETIVVPLPAILTGEPEDSEVKIQVSASTVKLRQSVSSATLDWALTLPDRSSADRKLLRALKSRIQPSVEPTWIAELTTINDLADHANSDDSTVGAHLFERCLVGLNMLIDSYLVASEDYAIRTLRMESLDYFALVEFRDRFNRPLQFGGMLTLPKSTAPDSRPEWGPLDLGVRMRASIEHRRVKHPMDLVVKWHMRALYHSFIGGDYEMSLVALMVSAEALITGVWRTQQVDEGKDSGVWNSPPHFAEALKQISANFGDDWSSKKEGGPVADFWHDCYLARNEAVHQGSALSSDLLDVAIEAYLGLRSWIEQNCISQAARYPRTALMVHGSVGVSRNPTAWALVEKTLTDIRENNELAFWLPVDMPRVF